LSADTGAADTPQVEPEFELMVSNTGAVLQVRQTISSGDPEKDRLYERYLRQWQFMPLEEDQGSEPQTGRVRITHSAQKG
jgi:TonB family protein